MKSLTTLPFRRKTLSHVIFTTLLASIPVINAQAQDRALEEIVVTAQFREQNVQDIPISVTAVSGEMLDARSQTKLSDIANNAPNVTMSPNAGAFGPSINASIRGIGQYDFNPALEPGVGIYIDDVYYGALTGAQFDLLDLDRVEILRGPQGTLAGKNSIGGAIKLHSSVPTGDNTGYLAATIGSNGRIDTRGSADFALSDNVFMRLSGVSKKNDGYIKRLDYGCANPGTPIPAIRDINSGCVTAREGDDDTSALRAMFQINATDSLGISIITDTSESNSNTLGGVLISGSNPGAINAAINGVTYNNQFNTGGTYVNYANYVSPASTWVTPAVFATHPFFSTFDGATLDETRHTGRTHIDSSGISIKLDYDISNTLNLESITAYREYFAEFSNDNDLSPLAIGLGYTSLDYSQKSQEFRLNGEMAGGSINYTAGLFFFEQETSFKGFQDLRYTPYPLAFTGGAPELPAETKAAFLNVSWDINDALTANLGLRYTEEEKTYNYARQNRDGTPHDVLGGLDGLAGYYEGDNVDYRMNMQYRFNDDLMAYASVSTGVKGGGIGPRPFNEFQALPFGQEEVVAYEVGVKTDLFDNRLRLNASYFLNDYTDIQLSISNCSDIIGTSGVALGTINAGVPCALPQNAGDADIQGLELEAMFRLDNGLAIDASFSTLDFEYTSLNPALGGAIPMDGTTPFSPELKWSFGISKVFDTNWGEITPRLDGIYRDELYTSASNAALSLVEDYTLYNAKVTWVNLDGDIEASLAITNLTDEYYYQTKFNLSHASGSVQGIPGRPREWALSLKKIFQ